MNFSSLKDQVVDAALKFSKFLIFFCRIQSNPKAEKQLPTRLIIIIEMLKTISDVAQVPMKVSF